MSIYENNLSSEELPSGILMYFTVYVHNCCAETILF